MVTYQDLQNVGLDENKRIAFVLSCIQQHKNTDLYKTAVTANEYDRKRNVTIMQYVKTLRTITGQEVPDQWSPNHKSTRNFFGYFTTQQNQFLLSNGATWGDPSTGEKLGADFDVQLQKAGKAALVGGVSFGFWNFDHMEVFKVTEFAPLLDEENGSLRAGVRFWQIDSSKPLRATLYEEDGYTDYIWNQRDETKTGAILNPKRSYKQIAVTSEADGTEIMDWENYPGFPIIPLWANPHHQSELVGIREQIDAYDLIKNGFLNDLDTAQVYWILRGAGGMDDEDAVRFLERLHMTKIANLDADQIAEPVTVQIPVEARERLLDRLERDLFKDYMALDVDQIRNGAVTATQILAAYEPLNVKADQYEYCVHEFLHGLLKIVGIDDEATFTRSKLVNVSEEVQTIVTASQVLDEQYVMEKILTILGDGDKAEEMKEAMQASEMQRMNEEDEGLMQNEGLGTQEN